MDRGDSRISSAATRTELSHLPALLDTRVSVGLLSCALVSTTHVLGAGWVSESWLGMPLGMWVVGAAVGLAHLKRHGRRVVPQAAVERFTGTDFGRAVAPVVEQIKRVGAMDVGDAVKQAVMSHPIYANGGGGDHAAAPPEAASAETSETAAATPAPPPPAPPSRRGTNIDRPVRVGVCGPEDVVERVVEFVAEETIAGAKFEPQTTPVKDSEDCEARGLDATITLATSGEAAVLLPEVPGREASWENWAARLPLGYPSLFPARVDVARVECGVVNVRSSREVRLVTCLAEAGGLLSQSEARTGAKRSAEWTAAHGLKLEAAMTHMARVLAADWSGENSARHPAGPMCRAVARGLSAWISTHDRDMDPQERRRWMEVCASFFTDEPESHLRLAAARIAAFEDDDALASLQHGFELLRNTGEMPVTDPLAFVLGEIEVGAASPLALGRISAGLAIAWATTPAENVDYLRDDLAEDLRYSGKLIGRDQDHAFLRRVMSQMDRLRSGTLPLRVKAAA